MLIAVAQWNPLPEPDANAELVGGFAARAAVDGARVLLAPEGCSTNFIDDPAATIRAAAPIDGPFGSAVLAASARHGIAVAAGTFTPAGPGDRVHNTVLVADRGELVASYRKIHLYDAFSFTESDTVVPGDDPAPVVDLDGVSIGFATCYDLRFPELFRGLAAAGAQVLALPSAWVSGPLKEEHFLTLLRARAIENTCYVVTADQTGRHTVGRSGGFDPLGLPLLDLGTAEPGYGLVEVRPGRIEEVRAALPSLANRRIGVDRSPAAAGAPAGADPAAGR
jgi:predicted amidohydrolase